jgi:acylphosphatase
MGYTEVFRHSLRRSDAGAQDALFAMARGSNETPQRREIYFSGRVQGVGFRYTTRDIAARFEVAGFVKNLADGRVLLVVEGAESTVDRFVAALESYLGRYIHSADTTTSPAKNEFTQFEIRH